MEQLKWKKVKQSPGVISAAAEIMGEKPLAPIWRLVEVKTGRIVGGAIETPGDVLFRAFEGVLFTTSDSRQCLHLHVGFYQSSRAAKVAVALAAGKLIQQTGYFRD